MKASWLSKRFDRRLLEGSPAASGHADQHIMSACHCARCRRHADVTGAVATNVGYLFFPLWNRGYATEALGAVVKHFEQHAITEMRALVTCGNSASERVLEGGFRSDTRHPGNRYDPRR